MPACIIMSPKQIISQHLTLWYRSSSLLMVSGGLIPYALLFTTTDTRIIYSLSHKKNTRHAMMDTRQWRIYPQQIVFVLLFLSTLSCKRIDRVRHHASFFFSFVSHSFFHWRLGNVKSTVDAFARISFSGQPVSSFPVM